MHGPDGCLRRNKMRNDAYPTKQAIQPSTWLGPSKEASFYEIRKQSLPSLPCTHGILLQLCYFIRFSATFSPPSLQSRHHIWRHLKKELQDDLFSCKFYFRSPSVYDAQFSQSLPPISAQIVKDHEGDALLLFTVKKGHTECLRCS